MKQNIKVAKQLVKLAKRLMASDELDLETLFKKGQWVEITKLAKNTKDPDILREIVDMCIETGGGSSMLWLKLYQNVNTPADLLEIIYENYGLANMLSDERFSSDFLSKSFKKLSNKAGCPHQLYALLCNKNLPKDIIKQIATNDGYGWDDIKSFANTRLLNNGDLPQNIQFYFPKK